MIFLVLTGADHGENLREIRRYRRHIDGVELRADYLADPRAAGLGDFLAEAALPVILTLRRPEDGGRWGGGEEERGRLYRDMLENGAFSFVDLEESSDLPAVEAAARRRNVTVIRSFHDFGGVPADLAARVAGLARGDGEIPKAAVMPRSSSDVAGMLDAFDALRGRRKILLGMGEFGFPLRVLAPRLGSFLTFASPGGDRVAPGLIDPETLDTVYRYHRIGPGTRVFGIIGNPILHSRSPHIHNPGYDRLGLDAVYVPFHADSAAAFLPVMQKLGIGGMSVTVPFKEEIIPLCGWTEEAVRAIGACNTVVPGPEGLRGYNTDAEGFLAPLRKLYGGGGAGFLGGLRAAVIGAGGSARSAVYALAREGARVLVLNRTRERARRLTEDLAGSLGLADGVLLWAGLDDAGHRERENHRDLLVNTTTMGMHPWEDLDPLEGRSLAGTGTVYDIVYSPRDTLLLRRAAEAGCRIVHGEEMLLGQAYRQFLLYTGREYPGPAFP